MDERCIGCPWFGMERYECVRKPPRFCEVAMEARRIASDPQEDLAAVHPKQNEPKD